MRGISFCASVVVLSAGIASADQVFFQGFETDTSDWFTNPSAVTRVASGSGGISSATGSFHAVVDSAVGGAFTRFDGYRTSFGSGFTAELAVYLDTGMSAGEGFDWSVAATGQDGAHQRDFIFHVAKDTSTGKLLVAGDNNTNSATREDLDTLSNFYEVTSSGWYTLQSMFYDNGAGVLAVDLNLIDSGGTVLFTETRSDLSDLIATEVGGNRYGWLTFVDVDGGLAIDDTSLDLSVVPLPSSAALAGLGLLGLGARRRRVAL